jgi:hypothetical protein
MKSMLAARGPGRFQAELSGPMPFVETKPYKKTGQRDDKTGQGAR